MEFLELFSLKDVAIVLTGLIIASIVRIYYDSHVTEKKAKQFGNSLGIYNNLIDETREGLFILSNDKQIIFSNNEARNILNIKAHNIDKESLETLMIGDEHSAEEQNLLNIIYTKTYLPNAYIVDDQNTKAISISINKMQPNKYTAQVWYIVILQDMTQISELRDGAETLLAA